MRKKYAALAGVILGLACTVNAQSVAPDSIVQVTAENQGLSLIAHEDLPLTGTFWLITSNGFSLPMPCAPLDQSIPIYALSDNVFLADGTAGLTAVNRHRTGYDTVDGVLAAQANAVVDLVSQTEVTQMRSSMRTMGMEMDVPMPSGTAVPDLSIPTPDYGTNLWISQWGLTNHVLTGLASNTLADVPYEIQTNTDLATTNWGSTGLFVYGSELTNWTALPFLPSNQATNLYIRLKSWASDGSGLPNWWQQQYFGTNVVDPYGNPAGDGWNNLQKFQFGWNPTNFYTPPAPQNFTVSLDGASSTATMNWLPSPGPVTSYTVSRDYYPPFMGDVVSQTFNVSADTTSIHDPQTLLPYDNVNPTIYAHYSIQANYSGGVSASTEQWLEPDSVQQMPSLSVISAPDGSVWLAVDKLSASMAGLRLTRSDIYAENHGDSSYDTSFFIPASSITNGIFPVPAAWLAPVVDGYGGAYYYWYVQAVNAAGGAASGGDRWNIQSAVMPFYDGRRQLKQNLTYQLRAASVSQLFNANPLVQDSANAVVISDTNYVVSSYNLAGNITLNQHGQTWLTDVTAPFKLNCFFRNFVFDASALSADGWVTNSDNFNPVQVNLNPLPYQFNGDNFTAVLGVDASQWIAANKILTSNYAQNNLADFGLSFNGSADHCFINASARNYYGLPFLSAIVVQGFGPGEFSADYLRLNDTLSCTNANIQLVYPETAQPQFQTVEYDFWNPNDGYRSNDVWMPWETLPGQAGFSPANAGNSHLMAGVGTSLTIAGYAKLAVQNGYSDVHAYLGQYFDKAYKLDSSGNVTTNTTGILSHYGNFFATEPGDVALVTMPDLDTGERGTSVVHCVSLNVDANHDGNMDLSWNGADATSQNSPFLFWVNNDCDWAYYPGDPGTDLPCTPKTCDYLNQNIMSPRDLEDWARLWICGVPALTNAGYQVTLSWNVSSDNPAINLAQSVETNGGIGYLTDANIATAQTSGSTSSNPSYKFARVTPSQAYTFPANFFTNNANKYFLFEGAGIGSGELVLTVMDANSNTVVQTGIWLDLHDVKDFYERAVITDNTSGAKSSWTSSVEVVQPAIASGLGDDTNLIVLVHGINVRPWDCLQQGDTVFKRLYWAGYQGRFSTVKWPCNLLTPLPSPLTTAVFNESELQGYKASTAFTSYMDDLRSRFPDYRRNIIAHSQGNTVVSEALKYGLSFDTYILTQGALPNSAYDVNAANDPDLLGRAPSPAWQPMGYQGAYTNLTGNIVNFYNPQDPVLDVWVKDQEFLKPSIYFDTSYYFYDGTNSYYDPLIGFNYLVTDPEESRAMVSRSLTLPIGQSGPESLHGVIQSAIDLHTHFNFSNTSFDDHSAQWTWPIQTTRPYYIQILKSINP